MIRDKASIVRTATQRLASELSLVTLIHAPAGCGKTELARQLATRIAPRGASVTLGRHMADGVSFLTAVAAAVRDTVPDASLPSLASDDLVNGGAWLARLMTAVRPFVLQLDDLHRLGRNARVERILVEALRSAPPGFYLIITTRIRPGPVWVRHVAEGTARVVSMDHLALDTREAAELIAAQGATNWTPEALVEACGGWVLGARMLLRRPGPPAGRMYDEAGMVDLIETELLADLPSNATAILRRTPPLDGLDITVVAEVIGLEAKDFQALAAGLLFLDITVDGRVHVHDLLKVAIRQRWGETASDTRSDLLAAAKALAAGGDTRSALSLLSATQAWGELTALLPASAPSIAEAGDFGILLAALEPMPDNLRRASVVASYWHGVSLLNLDPPRARALLEEALEATLADDAAENETLLVPLWTACADGIWLEWWDCTRADLHLEHLPRLIAVAKRHGQEALLAHGAVAVLSIRNPAHPDFSSWEAQSLAAFFEPAPRHEAVRRGIQLFFRYCWGEGARWKAELVRARLDHLFGERNAPLADICTRLVATTEFLSIFESNAEVVFAALTRGLAATERHGQHFWDVTMANAALYRAVSQEDMVQLDAGIALLDQRLGPQSNPNYVAIHENFLACRHWLSGRAEAALEHALTAHRLAVANGFSISPVYYGLAIAAILSDLGRVTEARRWMSKARRTARAQRSHILTFLACLRGAALMLAAGLPRRAEPYLRNALATGAAQRFMSHPYLRRTEMEALFALARQRAIATAYVADMERALCLQAASGEPVRLVTHGGFDLQTAGHSRLGRGKAKRVPGLLALHLVASGWRGLTSEELVDRLWPDADAESGRNRLKSAVYRLRQLFGDPDAVRVGGDRVALNPERVSVDAWQLEALARTGDAKFSSALELHQGAFAGPAASGHPELLLYAQHLSRLLSQIAVREASVQLGANAPEAAMATIDEATRRLGLDDRLLAVAQAAASALGRAIDLSAADAEAD